MTDEERQTLYRMHQTAQRLLDQIDELWESAVLITGEPEDDYTNALCTHDFIYNSNGGLEALATLKKVLDKKYGPENHRVTL